MAPAWRDHSPVHSTSASQVIRPFAVTTATTRPSWVSMPVTPVFSKMRAPPARAPLISAPHRSEGLTRPSPGDQTAPITSSPFISGQRSLAVPASMTSASIP